MYLCATKAKTMRRIITFLLILLTAVSAHAVLKEKNLDQTLQILRTELTEYHRELSERLQKNQKQSEQLRNQLISILKRSNQNSLMLYSQKQEYVFDLTYACHEATELYQEFQRAISESALLMYVLKGSCCR